LYSKISIIIPVYNEADTIEKLLDTVIEVPMPFEKEIIVVDDGSSDHTPDLLKILAEKYNSLSVFQNPQNRGKGYTLRKGIQYATGDIIVIQDADLEYDPYELPQLIQPIIAGRADVVFGSRFISSSPKRVLLFWHYLGNKFLTTLSNIFSNLNLSDMETCYKVFRSDCLKKIHLAENRFGFEPEVTYKISRIREIRIYEMGISYYGRSYAEGKKIGWKDCFRALYVILKCPLLYFFRGDDYVFKKTPKI
jgi:glycosyltransferase involved in cell wall biosynthesis